LAINARETFSEVDVQSEVDGNLPPKLTEKIMLESHEASEHCKLDIIMPSSS